jgi:hypothetical protein
MDFLSLKENNRRGLLGCCFVTHCSRVVSIVHQLHQTTTTTGVYTFYPDLSNSIEKTQIYAVPKVELVGCYSITWYAGFAVLLAAIFHILTIAPGTKGVYEYYVVRNQSPFRWIEYSFSCPLLRLLIAQIAGITDIYSLILIFFLGQATIFFAVPFERLNAKARADGYKQDWLTFHMSCICHLVSWGVVIGYFFNGMAQAAPPLALTLVVTLFILELAFPIVFALQWGKVGPFKDYMIGEFCYICLSFTAKTFLGWTALIGANAYSKVG